MTKAYALNLRSESIIELSSIYGSAHLTYNVHSYIHLPNDVRMYGSLDNCSTFKYENYLYQLAKNGNNILSQIFNRLLKQNVVLFL